MPIRVSLPENLFSQTQMEFAATKVVLRKIAREMNEEKARNKEFGMSDSARLASLKIQYRKAKILQESLKTKMDLYWDYVILRSVSPEKYSFIHKDYVKEASQFLGINPQQVNRKKRDVIKAGFAYKEGKKLIFLSKDAVWQKFGVLVNKHKKNEKGERVAHQSLGVYKEVGCKKVNVKKGHINTKKGFRYKKDETFFFKKKLEVKVIKFFVDASQLNKTALKHQAALAFYKLNVDRDLSRRPEENLREIEQDTAVDITCKYIAAKVGYTSVAAGWHIREELFQTGFIELCPNKITIASNITYEEAKEKYELQKGIQEETGLAYYYNKKDSTVYGVRCYSICVNGYKGIRYCRKESRKPKKEKKRWIAQYIDELMYCDGWPAKKIFGTMNHLFENEKINDYLFDLLEKQEKFSFSVWSNLKQAKEDLKK